MSGWENYDPVWLAELAREQLPEHPWLSEALLKCTQGRWESVAYIHFVDPASAAWTFEENLQLDSPTEGWLVLDILSGKRIGGLEFVSRISELR